MNTDFEKNNLTNDNELEEKDYEEESNEKNDEEEEIKVTCPCCGSTYRFTGNLDKSFEYCSHCGASLTPVKDEDEYEQDGIIDKIFWDSLGKKALAIITAILVGAFAKGYSDKVLKNVWDTIVNTFTPTKQENQITSTTTEYDYRFYVPVNHNSGFHSVDDTESHPYDQTDSIDTLESLLPVEKQHYEMTLEDFEDGALSTYSYLKRYIDYDKMVYDVLAAYYFTNYDYISDELREQIVEKGYIANTDLFDEEGIPDINKPGWKNIENYNRMINAINEYNEYNIQCDYYSELNGKGQKRA